MALGKISITRIYICTVALLAASTVFGAALPAPQATSTTAASASLQTFMIQADNSGTPADGTKLEGVDWEAGIIAEFNAQPSDGYGPQLTVQNYTLDTDTNYLYDGTYPLAVNYDVPAQNYPSPGQVFTCDSDTSCSNAEQGTGLLVCEAVNNLLTCSLPLANGTTLDTFYLTGTSSQELMFDYRQMAIAKGALVTLQTIPVSSA